jgi:Bacterial PH domain
LVLREDEVRVISVTPVGRGLVRPVLYVIAAAAAVQYSSWHVRVVREQRPWLLLFLVGPGLVLLATRSWRWRSHKIHVTNQRVIVEGGVAHHFRSFYELRDVVATRVEQRFAERIVRRGSILIDTVAGPVRLGRVRHPAALARLVDRERSLRPVDTIPLDTVFPFPQTPPTDYRDAHRGRRSHR